MKKLFSFVLPITWLPGMNTGWGNGYVAVPKGHPWFGKGYDDIEASIHGGLTYADKPRKVMPKKAKNMWVVGFDCAHYGDNLQTCPKKYVETEAKRLLKQAMTASK